MKYLIQQHKQDFDIGICSICSAYSLIIEATLCFVHDNKHSILSEASSYQVISHRGHTDLKAENVRSYIKGIATKVIMQITRGAGHARSNYWQNKLQVIKKAWLSIAENAQLGFCKICSDISTPNIGASVVRLAEEMTTHSADLCLRNGNIAAEEQQTAFRNGVYDCKPIAFVPNKEVSNA